MLNKRHAVEDITNINKATKDIIIESLAKKVRTSQSNKVSDIRTCSILSPSTNSSKSTDHSSNIGPTIDSNRSAALLLSINPQELPLIDCCNNSSSDCTTSATANAISIHRIGSSLSAAPLLSIQIQANIVNQIEYPVKKFSHKKSYYRPTVNPTINNRYVDCINRFSHARYYSTRRSIMYRNSLSRTIMMLDHIYYLSALLLALCVIITRPMQVDADAALVSSAQRLKVPNAIGLSSSTRLIRIEMNGNQVKPGDPIPAKNFKHLDLNKITWDAGSYDALYTLVLVDLDRKPGSNSTTETVYNQYASFNIAGSSVATGQSIVAYEPPSVPCQPSTKHRMAMLLFHQSEAIDLPEVAYLAALAGQTQKRFLKIDDFIHRHRLDLYAASVFQAIGESNGICSGSSTIHNFSKYTYLLVAMVTAIATFGFINGKQF